MTGNAKTTTQTRTGWLSYLTQTPLHYVAVDGGSGSHVLTELLAYTSYVQQAASPRHANLLLLIEPIGQKLVPAIRELATSLARPIHVLIVGEAEGTNAANESLEAVLPGSRRIPQLSAEAILANARQIEQWPALEHVDGAASEPTTIPMPAKHEQEMATELAVLSLGPVQPFTNGPVRIFLICDGEQVFSAQLEAGYATRNIEQAMLQADWLHDFELARRIDPLAPLAGQLAYVQALEQLQHWQAPLHTTRHRDAALALERTQNMLWWTARFAHLLDDAAIFSRAYRLARTYNEQFALLWQQAPAQWIVPDKQAPQAKSITSNAAIAELRRLVNDIDALKRYVERNRLLMLRTRDIGVLSVEQLRAKGVSGPVLQASEQGTGDVQSRLVTRLQNATLAVQEALHLISEQERGSIEQGHGRGQAVAPIINIPEGEVHVTVQSPRGTLDLHLSSEGKEQPASVLWQRPSAALLALLPDILIGQKLVDAEITLASLDISMAEADG